MAQEPTLASLIASVNAAEHPDVIRALASQIKQAVRDDVDPYLLIGTLIEGIVYTLTTNIPKEKQRELATCALLLLTNRSRAMGLLGQPQRDKP
jgi:hypothetical protein